MELDGVSETLFITLYAKALMSKNNIFLHDSKSEEIVSNIDYNFASLKQSKWLSMFLSLRSLIIDELCNKYIDSHKNATIIHLGCGLDSRALRLKQKFKRIYDVDVTSVIKIRGKYFDQDEKHIMIGSSVIDYTWLEQIEESSNVLIVAEGLMMYLSEEEVRTLINMIDNRFENVHIIFDSYSNLGVKLSKIKNPVKKMNAKIKYGIDKPENFLRLNDNLVYENTHIIKKDDNNIQGLTKFIFNNIYCGKIGQSIYKIYEFKLKNK